MDLWVLFDRFWPLKSTSAFRPLNPFPSPWSSLLGLVGLKLLFDAHACVRRPRLQQGPVNTEMLRGHVATQLRLVHHRSEELVGDLVIQQPLAVLGERRWIERFPVDRDVEEPFEQHVVVQPFAERPLRTHRVHRHQHRRLQQGFGRHRPATRRRIHRVELAVHARQHLVHHHPDTPDRMIRRDQILGRQRRQHRQLTIRSSTHHPSMTKTEPDREPFFSTLLVASGHSGVTEMGCQHVEA